MDSHSTHHLPHRLMPFVGRQVDLEGVLNLLQSPSIRLVTILGVGGIGKTSFAIELARVLQDQFQHGVVFVPLAQLSTVDELLPMLAGTLGVHISSGSDLRQAVLDHIAGRQILLVLDNFEHLLKEAALICDILIAGLGVKVLITSREKLGSRLWRLCVSLLLARLSCLILSRL